MLKSMEQIALTLVISQNCLSLADDFL